MLDTATSSAARRSTYRTIPKGSGQPPTDTARGVPRSTATSITSASTNVADSVMTDTATCARLRRPRSSVRAAPKSGRMTKSGTSKLTIGPRPRE